MGQLPAHHINKQTNKHQHVVIHGYAIIIILVNYESVTLDYCSYCAVDWSGRNQTSLWSWLCSRSCSNKLEHWRMIWSTSLGCCEAVAYLGKSVGLHHILNLFLFIRQCHKCNLITMWNRSLDLCLGLVTRRRKGSCSRLVTRRRKHSLTLSTDLTSDMKKQV